MSAGKLLLHLESEPTTPPSVAAITATLREIGFIGVIFPDKGPNHFLTGPRYLQLISFLGCSPQVNLEPTADSRDNFAYVGLLGPWDRQHLIYGKNTRPPGCPVCNGRIPNWLQLADDGEAGPAWEDWKCPACGARNPPADWNWRQQAGVGRFFILVNEIFPSEAVPSNELLNRLRDLTEAPWKYFYVQD